MQNATHTASHKTGEEIRFNSAGKRKTITMKISNISAIVITFLFLVDPVEAKIRGAKARVSEAEDNVTVTNAVFTSSNCLTQYY